MLTPAFSHPTNTETSVSIRASTFELTEPEQEEEKKTEEVPRTYMTAADFDRVCSKLNSISNSYERSAGRYEAAIE